MIRAVLGTRHGVSAITCLMVALGAWSDSCAGDIDEAEQLFAGHCAVCHGADRGGYIGPALNRDETMLTEVLVHAKITTGGVGTLMPQHPTWRGTLSRKQIDQLASLVAQQPKRQVSWGLEEIRLDLLESDDQHYIDLAGRVHDRGEESVADLLVDLQLASIDRHIQEIKDIDAALMRVAAGNYGMCIDCESSIAVDRLKAYPTAMRCQPCQVVYERLHAGRSGPSL